MQQYLTKSTTFCLFFCIFVYAIYAFAHRNIRQILSKHVLSSLMEALFNVPAKSAFPNVVRSDKTQVHLSQVLLPVSHRPGATLSRVCALRFCLVFSEALRSCLESSFSSSSSFCLESSSSSTSSLSLSLLCPPETGGTSAAEGVDITLNPKL